MRLNKNSSNLTNYYKDHYRNYCLRFKDIIPNITFEYYEAFHFIRVFYMFVIFICRLSDFMIKIDVMRKNINDLLFFCIIIQFINFLLYFKIYQVVNDRFSLKYIFKISSDAILNSLFILSYVTDVQTFLFCDNHCLLINKSTIIFNYKFETVTFSFIMSQFHLIFLLLAIKFHKE